MSISVMWSHSHQLNWIPTDYQPFNMFNHRFDSVVYCNICYCDGKPGMGVRSNHCLPLHGVIVPIFKFSILLFLCSSVFVYFSISEHLSNTLYHLKGTPRGGGGGLNQIYGSWVQHVINYWSQSDLRFCKNEGSKRSKINEKGSQLDRKSWRKYVQNA